MGEVTHQHVPPDDPSYAGFRIRQLWAVVLVDPADDTEGMVWVNLSMARAYNLTEGPAFASDERRLHHLRELASDLVQEGHPVEIKHFVLKVD